MIWQSHSLLLVCFTCAVVWMDLRLCPYQLQFEPISQCCSYGADGLLRQRYLHKFKELFISGEGISCWGTCKVSYVVRFKWWPGCIWQRWPVWQLWPAVMAWMHMANSCGCWSHHSSRFSKILSGPEQLFQLNLVRILISMRKMHPIWHMYIRSSQARQDSTETTEIMGSTTKQLCVTFAEMDSDLYQIVIWEWETARWLSKWTYFKQVFPQSGGTGHFYNNNLKFEYQHP